jgi:hypothetical protein
MCEAVINKRKGEELMFIMDLPYAPIQDTPIVLALAAPSTTPQPDYLLKMCQETESTGDPMAADRGVDPAGLLAGLIGNMRNQDLLSMLTADTIKITMLQGTTNGKLVAHTAGNGRLYYMYAPPPNYTGNDSAVFLAEFEGKVYKIVINLVVSPTVGESPLLEGEQPVCSGPQLIKINGKPVSGSSDYKSWGQSKVI